MKNMPQIDLTNVTATLASMSYTFVNPFNPDSKCTTVNALDAAQRIIATQGKNKGCLRASKPPMHETIIERVRHGHTGRYRDNPLADCAAAQVWRYVAFEASPIGQHHCLPIMADFDAPFDMTHDESRQFAEWCHGVANTILTTIKDKPGLDRWGHALGYF